MDQNAVHDALDKFAKNVVKQAKLNNKARAKYNLEVFPNSFALEFTMKPYEIFQDKGVSGIIRKFDTKFSYKNKRPPSKVFDKWSKNATRSASGQYANRKGVNYAAATTVFKYGIFPRLFFTAPFERLFAQLPKDVVEGYGLEIDRAFDLWLDKPNLEL